MMLSFFAMCRMLRAVYTKCNRVIATNHDDFEFAVMAVWLAIRGVWEITG